jgi:hypothetical protein
MAEMVAVPQPRPYRWGRFQGWASLVLGTVQILTMFSVLYWPDNHFAVSFFEASDPRLLKSLQRDLATQNYAGIAGSVTGSAVLMLPLGVLILKKRMSLFFFIILNISKAVFQANLIGIVYWVICTVYYAKRRMELRWP